MNIFDIHEKQAELFQLLEDNEGELSPELEKAFDELELSREDAFEGWIKYYANTKSDIEQIKEYIDSFQSKKRRLENRIESIGKTLSFFMSDGEKFKFPMASLFKQRTVNTELMNPDNVPKEYKEVEVKEKISLKKARDYYELTGEQVPGIKITETMKAVVRLNKR